MAATTADRRHALPGEGAPPRAAGMSYCSVRLYNLKTAGVSACGIREAVLLSRPLFSLSCGQVGVDRCLGIAAIGRLLFSSAYVTSWHVFRKELEPARAVGRRSGDLSDAARLRCGRLPVALAAGTYLELRRELPATFVARSQRAGAARLGTRRSPA